MSIPKYAEAESGSDQEIAAEKDRLWRTAIAERRLVLFTYDGLARLAEPHDYGELRGLARVLVFQLAGGSRSGGLPAWRLITVAKASKPELLDWTFAGPRDLGGEHGHWDRLFASVGREPFGE